MPQSVFKVNDLNKIVKKGRINRNKSVKVISITWRYWNFYFNSFFKVFWHFLKKSHTRNFRVSCVKLCAHTKNFVFFVCNFVCTHENFVFFVCNFVCTHEIFVFLCIVFVCVCYTRTHTRNTIFSVFKCLLTRSNLNFLNFYRKIFDVLVRTRPELSRFSSKIL